ncbi:hypothetical protein LGM71_06625 [Burkholderia sp. AU33545]|uniref:hypothetical protein n=1 Tax=Burkholderia sp. AU33545 TaxID=2879631 RepID=UPI001CF34462|nr:hypothetical protein [Burkholderia sp. AU33545]MCA8200717.1 hypothetical protein [Burkholderia sp. AU33545]
MADISGNKKFLKNHAQYTFPSCPTQSIQQDMPHEKTPSTKRTPACMALAGN